MNTRVTPVFNAILPLYPSEYSGHYMYHLLKHKKNLTSPPPTRMFLYFYMNLQNKERVSPFGNNRLIAVM